MKTTSVNPLKATKKPAVQVLGCACFLCFGMGQVQAQTCKDNIAATTPDNRFEILAGGSEVKDTKTGLIWQRCTLGQNWNASANTDNNSNSKGSCTGKATKHNWADAQAKVQALGNGYRLPSIEELKSIIEKKCYAPAVNNTIFPDTNGYYWSSSPYAKDSDHAWIAVLSYGYANTSHKNLSNYVRAVRDVRKVREQ